LEDTMSHGRPRKFNVEDAPFYVLANDTFLSGWGEATGKINTVVVPCQTNAEIQVVADNLRGRPDMDNVHVTSTKPGSKGPRVRYSVLDRESAPRLFEAGSWQNGVRT
jgi:hypothetical protein